MTFWQISNEAQTLADAQSEKVRNCGERLIARYTESGLAYHNADHLRECMTLFDESADLAKDAFSLGLAIWFHDAIYDPRRNDNEAQSAREAREALSPLGCSGALIDRVCGLIDATRHQALAESPDARLICDIDLAVLGRDSAGYRHYTARVRQEYAWVEGAAFRAGRARVLRGFLERDAIYQTDRFRDRFEAQARANLQAELAALTTGHAPNSEP